MNQSIINNFENSPLSVKEIQRIDQLNLPMLDKHHLRLLAHCLEVFKSISFGAKSLPSAQDQLQWCKQNPKLQNDPEFVQLLVDQFEVASNCLAKIANKLKVEPMDLTLEDLIDDAFSE